MNVQNMFWLESNQKMHGETIQMHQLINECLRTAESPSQWLVRRDMTRQCNDSVKSQKSVWQHLRFGDLNVHFFLPLAVIVTFW